MLELVKKRRSVRRYSGRKIDEEVFQKIMQTTLYAPTAKGRDVIRYIAIRDRQKLKTLSKFKMAHAEFIADCDIAVAVLGNKKIAERTYHQDACIAATYIMLAASAEGIGSCWANVLDAIDKSGRFSQDILKEELEIPDEFEVECIIALGYPKDEPRQKRIKKLSEVLYLENYGKY